MRPADLVGHLRSAKGAGVGVSVVLGVVAVAVGGDLGHALGIVAILVAGTSLAAVSTLASLSWRDRDGSRRAPRERVAASGVDVLGTRPPLTEDAARVAPALRRSVAPPSLEPSPSVGARRDAGDGPLVTVVVPCFNEERFIQDAVRSVMRQTLDDWECIVVDDASTDSTPRLANALAGKDDRVTVVRHRVNGGLSAARNTGLRLARGRYVTFLDGDDMLTARSLEDRVVALDEETDDEVIGSYCGVRFAMEDATVDDLEEAYGRNGGGRIDFVSSRGQCPFNAHAPICRTDVLRSFGGFDESMTDGAEDWELWSRVLRAGFVWVPASSTTAIYRQKAGSMVREKLERHVELSDALLDSAYQPFDVDELPVVGPTPFSAPLPRYEQDVKRAVRVLRSAAMALIAGNTDAADGLVRLLGDVPREGIDTHATAAAAAAAGTRRTFGLQSSDVRVLQAEMGPLRARLEALLDRHVPRPDAGIEVRPGPVADVVAVPANAAQARLMVDVAAQTPERSWVFVDVARVTGDQGVGDLLADAGVTTVSLNEWSLGRWTGRLVVVASPRLSIVEELVREADGARVVDLAVDGVDVMTVEGLPPRVGLETVDQERLVGLVQGATDLPTGGPWRLRGRATETAWRLEEYPATTFDPDRIASFKDVHKGERLCIIGNGPSLNDLDLTLLRDEATVGVNGIFYKTDEVGIDLLYYVVEDTAVMDDNLERIREYRARGHRFFPSIYRDKVGEGDDTTFFMMNRGFYAEESPDHCVPRFSTDLRQRVFTGQSVTIINLQLAYWMGFTEVVLIGMDFSYTIPDDAEVDGNIITSQSDDPNHFHPDYFGKGKVWKDPKLDRVLANYQLAKLMFEQDGRRIVNATAGGKLELFDRIPFEQLYAR